MHKAEIQRDLKNACRSYFQPYFLGWASKASLAGANSTKYENRKLRKEEKRKLILT